MTFKNILISITAISTFSLNACGLEANPNRSCELSNLPINREESCISYQAEDERLNSAYKKLINLLDPNSKPLLRQSQREWITFRDNTCQEVMEKSAESCPNAECIDLNHDNCIVKTTQNRASELIEFIDDIDAAKNRKFDFSKRH